MTYRQPQDQPRRNAGQPPATPPQWRGSHQGQPQPAYWAPPVAATAWQPPAQRPASRWLPYPRHLVRFPSGLMPRARRRRGRGHSLGYYVYLGSHPVAVMFALCATMVAWCLLLEWIMAVALGWLLWCYVVTLGWLVALPFAALKRR